MPDHSSGTAMYSDEQKRRVIAFLDAHRGPENPTTTEEIERECGIRERALRQLISEIDGTLVDGWPFLVAYSPDHTRLWLATSPEEARAATRRLRHQAYNLNVRCDRREQIYDRLNAAQGALL